MLHTGAMELVIDVVLDGKMPTHKSWWGLWNSNPFSLAATVLQNALAPSAPPNISLCKSGMQDSNLQPPVSKTGNLTIDIIPALHLFSFQNVSPVESEEIESSSLGPQPSALAAML